jgi:hypothetical protein
MAFAGEKPFGLVTDITDIGQKEMWVNTSVGTASRDSSAVMLLVYVASVYEKITQAWRNLHTDQRHPYFYNSVSKPTI